MRPFNGVDRSAVEGGIVSPSSSGVVRERGGAGLVATIRHDEQLDTHVYIICWRLSLRLGHPGPR